MPPVMGFARHIPSQVQIFTAEIGKVVALSRAVVRLIESPSVCEKMGIIVL